MTCARLEHQPAESSRSDSVDYFQPGARGACQVGFFSDLDSRAPAWDKLELSSRTACMGRLFFHIPGKIAHGQHWLNVEKD